MRHSLVLPLAVLLASCATTSNLADGRWLDLTHDLAEDSIFWPTSNGFRHEQVAYGETPGGWFYSSYDLHLSEHGGTHLDAPIHFAAGKHTADKIPLAQLVGPAARIDVSARALAERDYRASADDLAARERAPGAQKRRDGMDSCQSKVWTNAKAKGVIIYAIGVGVSSHSRGVLQACATSTDKYYDVTDAAQLTEVFNTIAGSIQNLRIAK